MGGGGSHVEEDAVVVPVFGELDEVAARPRRLLAVAALLHVVG